MARQRRPTCTEDPQTLAEVHREWAAGRDPDFHVYANQTAFIEGDEVTIIGGPHEGRNGVVLAQVDVGWVEVAFDGHIDVIEVMNLRHPE